MIDIQAAMHTHPSDKDIIDAEIVVMQEYKHKHESYLDLLKKKAKIPWIEVGDENTKLQDKVYNIYDINGVWHDKPTEVSDAFLDFYTSLLGVYSP